MSKLLERRAIRKYIPDVEITKKEMSLMLEEATRAPSSMNMQPWRFIIVDSKQGKEKLRPVLRGNQLQLETSSAMIVIFTDIHKFDLAEKIYTKAVKQQLIPEDVKEKQLRNIANMISNLSNESIEKSGLIDCGLVAMQLMHIAKEHGYDTCPIGGFNHEKIANALGLDEKRYKPVLIVSIGKAAEDGYSSIRLDVTDVATWI